MIFPKKSPPFAHGARVPAALPLGCGVFFGGPLSVSPCGGGSRRTPYLRVRYFFCFPQKIPTLRRVAPAGMLRYFHFVSVPGFTGLVYCTGPFLLAGIAHYADHMVWAMPVRTLTDGYGLLRTIGTRHSVCHVLSKFRSAWLSCFLCPVRSVPFSSVFPCSHPVLCIIGGSRGRSPTADLIGAARLPPAPCVPPAIRPRCGGYLPSILMNLGRAVSKSTPYQL